MSNQRRHTAARRPVTPVGPMSEPAAALTLHVWPGHWGLPSFEPGCLATVLYLQLAIPGKFIILECNNPDVSPTGQLPLLVHGQVAVSSFSSIVKYITGLERSTQSDLDASLTPLERSERIARISHIESHFGNLVYHTFYSSPTNWEAVIHPALASMYGVPQRYYVPGRIRMSYKPRLESVGLWNLPQIEAERKSFLGGEKKTDAAKKEAKQKIALAFEREKMQEKARDILGIYARLLEGKQFVYQSRPTTLDLMLTAHTLLLIAPPLPDTLIKELVEEWYTTLAEHAKRIRDMAFGSDRPGVSVHSSRSSIWSLVPLRRTVKSTTQHPDKTPDDVEYEKLTWGFLGLALGSVAAYFAIMGSPIKIVMSSHGELVEEEEEGEEGEGGEGRRDEDEDQEVDE